MPAKCPASATVVTAARDECECASSVVCCYRIDIGTDVAIVSGDNQQLLVPLPANLSSTVPHFQQKIFYGYTDESQINACFHWCCLGKQNDAGLIVHDCRKVLLTSLFCLNPSLSHPYGGRKTTESQWPYSVGKKNDRPVRIWLVSITAARLVAITLANHCDRLLWNTETSHQLSSAAYVEAKGCAEAVAFCSAYRPLY